MISYSGIEEHDRKEYAYIITLHKDKMYVFKDMKGESNKDTVQVHYPAHGELKLLFSSLA